MIDPTGPLARRFPLVARPRPACIPLRQRVADLGHRAATAARNQDPAAATAVFNLSALLASDCGLPDLARHWCHRLARAALRNPPQDAREAIHSLEPIVNLARLASRAANGLDAWSLLENLYQAVASRTDTVIDGIEIPAADLTGPPDAYREVRAWLWAVLLSDGARALAIAGRWDDAYHRLDKYNGIGHRMLDGRQIAVIAHATTGNHDAAAALLHTTQPGQPWEAAVTDCLTLLNEPRSTGADLGGPLAAYRALDTATVGLAVFHTRLGLCLLDSYDAAAPAAARPLAAHLIDNAATDGYAARDVLTHSGCRGIATDRQTLTLTILVEQCGLGSGLMPDPVLADICAALDVAEQVIRHS